MTLLTIFIYVYFLGYDVQEGMVSLMVTAFLLDIGTFGLGVGCTITYLNRKELLKRN